MDYLEGQIAAVAWIFFLQRQVALRAGGYYPLGPGAAYLLDVVLRQPDKVLGISRPEQVVSAAAFVREQCRHDIQSIKQFHRTPGNVQRSHPEVSEDYIEIGLATSEVQDIGLRGRLEALIQPAETILAQVVGSHDVHQGLQGAAVAALTILPQSMSLCPQRLNKLGILNTGLAPFLAHRAG